MTKVKRLTDAQRDTIKVGRFTDAQRDTIDHGQAVRLHQSGVEGHQGCRARRAWPPMPTGSCWKRKDGRDQVHRDVAEMLAATARGHIVRELRSLPTQMDFLKDVTGKRGDAVRLRD